MKKIRGTTAWVAKTSLSLAVLGGLLYAPGKISGQAEKVAAQTPVSGDAMHGRDLFAGKGGCLACHRVDDEGSRLGPNLTEIGSSRTVAQLRKSLEGSAPGVLSQYRLYRVVDRNGKVTTGRLLNQSQFSLQMLDAQERLVAFKKSDLREYGFTQMSPMPSYQEKLSPAEQADLIAFLATLQGPVEQ
jgi:cytochrome c oxidase cbb3-type subunit III